MMAANRSSVSLFQFDDTRARRRVAFHSVCSSARLLAGTVATSTVRPAATGAGRHARSQGPVRPIDWANWARRRKEKPQRAPDLASRRSRIDPSIRETSRLVRPILHILFYLFAHSLSGARFAKRHAKEKQKSASGANNHNELAVRKPNC